MIITWNDTAKWSDGIAARGFGSARNPKSRSQSVCPKRVGPTSSMIRMTPVASPCSTASQGGTVGTR